MEKIWWNSSCKIKRKKEFGKLSTQQGKLSTQQVTYPEDIQNEEDYFNMLRRDYRTADPERKIFLLFVIQTEANMQREKGRALTDMDEEIAANKASDDLLDLSPEEKEEWIQHVYGQPPGWTPYAEVKLNLGSKEWQDMRKEIARWKKSGGTLHAKMTGKPDPKEKKEVEELIAERGPNLTEEDKDLIAWTPGIIPPWFNKNPSKDSYDYHAIQAIKDLGVSAMEVHYAVERAYTGDPPLTAKDKDILRVGWGQVFAEKM